MDWVEGDVELWCKPNQAPADGRELSRASSAHWNSLIESRGGQALCTLGSSQPSCPTSSLLLPRFLCSNHTIPPSVPLYRLLFAWNMLCPFLSSKLPLLYLLWGRISPIFLCIHQLQHQLPYITLLISIPYSPPATPDHKLPEDKNYGLLSSHPWLPADCLAWSKYWLWWWVWAVVIT